MKTMHLLALLTFVLTACGSAPGQLTATAVVRQDQTQTAAPTKTATPRPTATPTKTSTSTLRPTAAPSKTATPIPMTNSLPGLITFASDRDGPTGIYMINADGNGEANILTLHPFNEFAPRWSPDGKKIAFTTAWDVASSQDNWEIYVINADSTGLVRLTDNPANDGFPSWSPDSQQIAFASDRDGNVEIYVIQSDGTKLRRLTNSPADDELPSWSSDGAYIAFRSNRDGNTEIYRINADGSEITRLTQNTDPDGMAAWSTVSNQLAFVSERDGNAEIYLMNADGTDVRRITDNPAGDFFPAWSPDGQWITFTSDRQGNDDIYVMKLDGDDIRQLTNDSASDFYSSWSPPGVTLSDEPWFGPPFCARDTDGDGNWDIPTTTFSTEDFFAYVVFPFRNMENGMEWSHVWDVPGDLDTNFLAFWDGGESGIHVAASGAPTFGPGKLTIQLFIEKKLMQEVNCEIINP